MTSSYGDLTLDDLAAGAAAAAAAGVGGAPGAEPLALRMKAAMSA
ncbi:hypothetical protein [Nocardioides sp.]|nr:hypothetical protein [Nocardioides sp.]HVX54600.1 hypothetical protein [Nocardioides sp.]